jgi:endonuclease YncB( thermonuclease family)
MACSLHAADREHGAAEPWRWTGVVTYVVDGDTLYVRPHGGGKPRSVRVMGIDAPEICQAGGGASRRTLQTQALNQEVTVFTQRLDDYGRDLARIDLQGRDVALWMVGQGQAWAYPAGRSRGPYGAAQREALLHARGIFADPSAEPPNQFRRRHGSCWQPRLHQAK